MNGFGDAWRLAKRELRGGTKGFRIFLACLILGVATIGAVGSLNQSITNGLARDGQILLGGDLDVRLSAQPVTVEQRKYFEANATVSEIAELRAMMTAPDARLLVELKVVDDLYPLVGTVETSPQMNLADALSDNGVLVDPILLTRLNAAVGDTVAIGQAEVQIRGVIDREPDRVASVINFGPRVLASFQTLENTQLLQPGSVIRYHYRLDLPDTTSAQGFAEDLNALYPEAGWRTRTHENAAPRVENFVERLALFLSFVGFTTLLIGGVGVSSGVRDFLNTKIATIATFKCLGAPSDLIFRTYLLQILLLSAIGTAIGLLLGFLIPLVAASVAADFFPVRPEGGLYVGALATAAAFGILTAMTFALWPLGRAQEVPARALFRDKSAPISGSPATKYKNYTYVLLSLLIFLIVTTAYRMDYTVIFIAVAAGVLGVLKLAGNWTVWAASRLPSVKNTSVRLAITALHRPGTTAPAVILSLGLGLSVLVTVSQINQNLQAQITDELPDQAPTYFFIDIQSDQVESFDETLASLQGTADYKRVPSLRGRITQIDGTDVTEATISPDAQWAVRGDRALTYSSSTPEGSIVIKGDWWPEDYNGAPLISLDSSLAAGFGVDIGDTLTLNILGRDVTAEIASLREINWRSMRFDFAIILSPGLLEFVPHSHMAAIHAKPETQPILERAIAQSHPNVSILRVEEALEAARTLMEGISQAIAVAASFTVLAGALVLAGAMASGRERRTYEAIVFKVLGATRGRMLGAYLMEYGVLGLITGVISVVVGSLASYGVVTYLMEVEWAFQAQSAGLTVIACLVLTIAAGFLGTWQALGQKAAPHLRNE